MQPRADDRVLEVKRLTTSFFYRKRQLVAVNGVSFSIDRGRITALVGESGCGKSVTGFSILRLIEEPGRITAGKILLHTGHGETVDILAISPRAKLLYEIRGGHIGMVFQEPMTALSPVHTVGNQLVEAIRLHGAVSRKAARRRAADLLQQVGINHPDKQMACYPYEFSGGMRQRAMIAMALAGDPTLLIADEPTTALDVTIQAQILALMKSLQEKQGLAILLITHDLGVVSQTADHVLVMYLGEIVESGPAAMVIQDPWHPYTRALLNALPGAQHRRRKLHPAPGSVPSLFERPDGCPFHPRCERCMRGRCDVGSGPQLRSTGRNREVACFAVEDEFSTDESGPNTPEGA